MKRRICPECGKTFYIRDHRNTYKLRLTCGQAECARRAKSKRQRERRYDKRIARWQEHARKEACREEAKRLKNPQAKPYPSSRYSGQPAAPGPGKLTTRAAKR
jgi:ribosomal protein S27AE